MPENIRKHRNLAIILIAMQIACGVAALAMYFRRRVSFIKGGVIVLCVGQNYTHSNSCLIDIKCDRPFRYDKSEPIPDVDPLFLLLFDSGRLLRLFALGHFPETRS